MGWFGFGGGGGGGSGAEEKKRKKRKVKKRPDTPAGKKAAASKLPLGPEGQDPFDSALWTTVPQRPRGRVKLDFEERQQVDYVRTIFRKNVWYAFFVDKSKQCCAWTLHIAIAVTFV